MATITPAPQSLVGDCDGGGRVTVNELVTGVNIALDRSPIDDCDALDADGNGRVTINELVQAVGAALAA